MADPVLEDALRRQKEDEEARAREAAEKQIRAAYVRTFESPDGRIVLKDLRKQFYDVDGYVPGSPADSHGLACARGVILRILTLLAEEAEGPKEKQKDAETS